MKTSFGCLLLLALLVSFCVGGFSCYSMMVDSVKASEQEAAAMIGEQVTIPSGTRFEVETNGTWEEGRLARDVDGEVVGSDSIYILVKESDEFVIKVLPSHP